MTRDRETINPGISYGLFWFIWFVFRECLQEFYLLKWSSYKLLRSKKSRIPEPGFGKDTGQGTKAGNYEKDLEELKKKPGKMSDLD